MIQNKFNIESVKLITSEIVVDTWGKVTYSIADNRKQSDLYKVMLARELSIYPSGYLTKANIDKIILCKDLEFNEEYRAAIPDPYKRALYLSVNGSYGESGETYLIHVLHHELHHLVEYAVWKNMYFDWEEWNKLNPEGFAYRSGGTPSFRDSEPDYYTVTHPLKGFLNLYSMMGGEEDRCELMAFLMSEKDRLKLLKYYPGDRIIQRKVRFIAQFVNDFAGTEFIDVERFIIK